jgi:hypothetical protein
LGVDRAQKVNAKIVALRPEGRDKTRRIMVCRRKSQEADRILSETP